MDQVSYFSAFLTDHVNLPDRKLAYLGDRVGSIYGALSKADLGVKVKGMKRQGSWAQRTIINPESTEEFDADFMLELAENHLWTPWQYQQVVLQALSEYCEGQSMSAPPEAKNRCVRVTYANYMHVDVVPYVNLARGGESIINAETDEWEDTDPSGLTQWMRDKDDITNGNLRRVIRLLKFLRDRRDYFEDTKSIILTTIVGGVVSHSRARSHPGCYDNVPQTLNRVAQDLSDWVRDLEVRPEVDDPSRAESTFTHRWPQHEYDAFRKDIQLIALLASAAIECDSWSQSVDRWRALFGERFGPSGEGSGSKFPAAGSGVGAPNDTETSTGRSGRAG